MAGHSPGATFRTAASVDPKLEEGGFVGMQKGFQGKKPRMVVRLTDRGRPAFRDHKRSMQQVLDDLPDSPAPFTRTSAATHDSAPAAGVLVSAALPRVSREA